MNVEFEARAFRIWQFCQSREWNCTVQEVADGIGISVSTVKHALGVKRWGGRLPGCAQDQFFRLASWQGGNRTAAEHVIRELVGERRELAE